MKKLRLFDSLKFVRFVVAFVACVFAIVSAHAATLPAGYTELQYIESTGTQYIDTGAVYKSSRIYNVDFQYVVYPNGAKGSLGARQTSIAGEGTFDIGCNSTLFYFYNNSTSANKKEPRDLARHTVEIDYTNSVFKFDGETLPWNAGTGAWQGTYNIYIGRENMAGSPNSNTGTVKWYSYKVYDNGTLFQNFVPAKNSSGVVGMYDLADANPSTAFHTNAGTGTFIAGEYPIKIATTKYNEESFEPVKTDLSAAMNAVEYVVSNTMTQAQAIDTIATTKQTRPDEGCTAKYCLLVEDEDGTPHWYPIAGANGVAHNLPAGYTELQYIESTGTQYIDTGKSGYKNTNVLKIKINPSQVTATSFVTFQNPNAGTNQLGLFLSGSRWNYQYSSEERLKAVASANTDVSIEATNGSLKINDVEYTGTPGTEFTMSENMLIGAAINGTTVDSRMFQGKIYYFRWENSNGNVLFDGVPARRDSDGVLGMYDLADANPATAFHTNAGTGVFGEGPIVQ